MATLEISALRNFKCSSNTLFVIIFGQSYTVFFCLPWQKAPFPVYPSSQVHRKDPPVLVQYALESQLSIDKEHSSMSRKQNRFEEVRKAGKFVTAVQKYCWRLNTKCN